MRKRTTTKRVREEIKADTGPTGNLRRRLLEIEDSGLDPFGKFTAPVSCVGRGCKARAGDKGNSGSWTMTKAFAYLRVSGRGQVDGDGFERQRLAIEIYAAKSGIEIERVYREEGVSGAKETMDRPTWSEMIIALQSSGVQTIIVEKLDRLARDLMVQETAIADIRRRGQVLVSVAEPDLMASDPTRVLVRQLMGAVAQHDKSQIVLRLRGARQRKKAATGRCEGQKPYGHHATEAEPLRFICEKAGQGHTPTDIAKILNADGVPSRRGAKWYPMVVSRILAAHPPLCAVK